MGFRGTAATRRRRPRNLISSAVNQLGEVGRTDQTGRFLSSQAEDSTRQQLRRSAAARFLKTQAEILWRDFRQEDIGLSKFGQ